MIGLIDNHGAQPRSGYLAAIVESIFKEHGYLQTQLGLDFRPEQAAMAVAVAGSLEGNNPLLFEAGTGVGKSLAYLIPGLIHSIHTERPFIVSSHTISLQEQIKHKDLEICRKLFQAIPELQRYAQFKTALMVGRANYCCTTRLQKALKEAQSGQTEMFPQEEREDLIRLAKWSAQSKGGLIQELSPAPHSEVWDQVNADSSTCSRKNCDASICFFQRARKELTSANCIILNHSLLFSLINAGMPPKEDVRGILLPDDFVVLDEAHRIPAIATEHFGLHVSSFAVDRALKRIYNPRKNRGLLKKHGQQWDLAAIENAIGACSEFFLYLGENFLSKSPIRRIHETDFCDNIVSGPLKEVAERLATIIQQSDDEHAQDELRDHRRRIIGYREAINSFISHPEEDHVHWLEKSGRKGQIVTMRSAPLVVAPYLRESLFNRQTSCILTSATLADGSSIESFQDKVGANAAESQIEYSPFNYKDNCRILIATDSPSPEPNAGRLDLDYLANMISWCARRVDGGTLVLFTSYHDLRQVEARCAHFFEKIKRPLLAQGAERPRNELTKAFKDAGNAILFGTDSFWTGVDIQGDALSQVIITRLPFENPSHPVSEARSEYLRERGGNPFAEIVVPDAVVKLRQGMGRLIRSRTDKGNIVILDSRIVNKPYGGRFLQSLPNKTYQRFHRTNREEVFSNFAF
ncbi:MAG: ATP-dependent DNA helicase [Verrucomicrobiota bacterium]